MASLRAPTTGEMALIVGVLVYAVLFPILGYKGFAYMAGIVIFALGIRWQISELIKRDTFKIKFYWWSVTPAKDWPWRWTGQDHWIVKEYPMPSEEILSRWIGRVLVAAALVVMPVFAFVLQRQGLAFSQQVETHLPSILAVLNDWVTWINQRFGTEAAVDVDAGISGLQETVSQVAGNTLTDVKDGVQGLLSGAVKVFATLIADYILLSVAAIIVAMIINAENWKKEVAFFNKRLDRGIQDPHLRQRVRRLGELFQEAVGLFMVGYVEVGFRLSCLFFVAMFFVLPLGLSMGTCLFLAFLLGYITAVPKIGGFVSLALAPFLVGTNLETGLGWFGFDMFSTGSVGGDVAVRVVLLTAVAKVMGLFEAYHYTPAIVGDRLGLTKFLIVATIVMAAKAGGVAGMAWGILGMLLFQAFKTLDEEAEAEDAATATDKQTRNAQEVS